MAGESGAEGGGEGLAEAKGLVGQTDGRTDEVAKTGFFYA